MYDELTTDLRRAANTWLAEEYKVCAEAVRYLLKESDIPACEEAYDKYTDTAGNLHWTGTHSGEHTIRTGDENMDGVVKIPSWEVNSRWTRKCLVCETAEDPTASIIREDYAWLCPKCRNGLMKLIRTEDEE